MRQSQLASPPCTQAQLAKLLGVSQVTICKSLANHSSISKPMREKVRRLAKQHGYRPNASARAMRENRFGAITLVQSSEPSRSILIPELLSGIHSALRDVDMHLMFAAMRDEELTNRDYVPRILAESSCDGLLINYNAGIPDRMVELIDDYHIPAVWINSQQRYRSVCPNDIEGGRLATEHLLKLGHRRIAYVDYAFGEACPYPVHYSTHDRFGGYSQAMQAAGLQPRKIRSPGGPLGGSPPGSILGFTQSWLCSEDRPTAVVAYTLETAKPIAMTAMARMGMDWTQQFSLVTFHTRRVDELGMPLTTMVLPEHEMGVEAVRMLMQVISDRFTEVPSKSLGLHLAEGVSSRPWPL